ncbi:sensor histidine kinase [Streptoalloteichus hindustanus]|uniref:histidine kinase n=1 Tax=Streptoalloteichus hindustanus TaxID=2017 RepID=A0A1M4Y188_STRHI|nr:histidine kinase [Streptoalloteichus hindustanus]SHE99475.1 Signal transduction histidine kinase [Streptoalloteichus hindustanus]
MLRPLGRWRAYAWDAGAILLAAADLVLAVGDPQANVPPYAHVMSWVACLGLVFRRRFPRTVLALCVPGLLVGYALVAAEVALYTVSRRRPFSWQVVVGCLAVWASAFVLWPLPTFLNLSLHDVLGRFMYSGLQALAPFALGLLMRTRTELSHRVRELAEGREREKRLHAHAVLAQERARLAREMHDVVSHQVTLIAMQAGALQTCTPDDEAREVARVIRQLSVRTLEELRQMVGVLRVTALDADAASRPGLKDLPELVAHSGVPVELSLGALPEPVPAPLSTAAYRTVQEALTNVRKHAPGAPTSVLLEVREDHLAVEIRNGNPATSASAPAFPSGGHGLVGLRERAELLGGDFQAERTEDGGFRVLARFPLAHTRIPETDQH